MDQKEIYKKIRRIQIQTTHLADDLLAGMYHSIFKGRGMEFEEVRPYEPGDEIRAIDWNVTARMQAPYIKNFREERELTVMLIVDVSASSAYGSKGATKKEVMAEVAALLAFSAIKNHDKVGLILFSDQIELYLPPKNGLRHVLRIIRELLIERELKGKSDLAPVLSFLGNVQKRTAVCFYLSDFIFPLSKKGVAQAARHYDSVAIGIVDPTEIAFPKIGLTALRDSETGQQCIFDSNSMRETRVLSEYFNTHQEDCRRLFESVGGGYMRIATDESPVKPILKFFKQRKQRLLCYT